MHRGNPLTLGRAAWCATRRGRSWPPRPLPGVLPAPGAAGAAPTLRPRHRPGHRVRAQKCVSANPRRLAEYTPCTPTVQPGSAAGGRSSTPATGRYSTSPEPQVPTAPMVGATRLDRCSTDASVSAGASSHPLGTSTERSTADRVALASVGDCGSADHRCLGRPVLVRDRSRCPRGGMLAFLSRGRARAAADRSDLKPGSARPAESVGVRRGRRPREPRHC